jgi:hypothetical protein
MKGKRYQVGIFLLTVFSAILLSPALKSDPALSNNFKEITVIHAQEYSGNATENISRSFSGNSHFESRIIQDFTCQVLQIIHSSLSQTNYAQVRSHLVQITPTVRVYKRIHQFLI